MGVLTDLLIADRSDAENIANSSSPISTWKGFDAKGHNDITLGVLLCILRNGQYDEMGLDEFTLLAQASDDGAWVFELPDDLVSALNQVSEGAIPAIASEWLQTNEMQDANETYAESFIKELKSLAQESISQQKSILMWISL